MKKAFSYIVIAIFVLFPTVGHAAVSASTTTATTSQEVEVTDLNSPLLQGKSLVARQKTVQAALTDSYTKLSTLASKTQFAVNQLNINGIDTSDAQDALIATNVNLDKAKVAIAAFGAITVSPKTSPAASLSVLKTAANAAETTLSDAKSHLIDSLVSLKTLLPALDTDNQ